LRTRSGIKARKTTDRSVTTLLLTLNKRAALSFIAHRSSSLKRPEKISAHVIKMMMGENQMADRHLRPELVELAHHSPGAAFVAAHVGM